MPKPDPETHLLTAALDATGGRAPRAGVDRPGGRRGRRSGGGAHAVGLHPPLRRVPGGVQPNAGGAGAEPAGGAGVEQPQGLPGRDGRRRGCRWCPRRLVRAGRARPTRRRRPSWRWWSSPRSPAARGGRSDSSRGDPAAAAHLAELAAEGDTLVQPYVASVAERGERSLIFLGGGFSHAVDKVPAPATTACRRSTAAVTARTAHGRRAASGRARAGGGPAGGLLYARVDMVEGPATARRSWSWS